MSYDGLRGQNHSLGSKPQQFERFQTGGEAVIANSS